jgi:hypothetical protein
MLNGQPITVALPHVGHHVLWALVEADEDHLEGFTLSYNLLRKKRFWFNLGLI